MDDEVGFLAVLERLLTTLGYRVSSFTDASAALGAIHDAELLLTDVFMPETDGIELSRKARLAKPGLPVLLMSGSPIESPEGLRLIKKPFSREALGAAIRAALEDPDSLSLLDHRM